MQWQRPAQPASPSPAATVPEGESVRMAALQAAWRRDRRVARRRIWLRWTLWGAQRYGVPAAGLFATFAGLWFAVRSTTGWLDAPPLSAPVIAATLQTVPATAPSPAIETTAIIPAASAPADLPFISHTNAAGMQLKFEPSLRASAGVETPVSSPATTDVAESPHPQLISENWLHSKEP